MPDSSYEGRHGQNQYLLFTKGNARNLGEAADGHQVLFKGMTGELTGASRAQVPGAMLRHTEVTLAFAKRIPGSAVGEEDFRRVLEIAYGCLNHFLDVYRFMTKDAEVRPLSVTEFHEVRAGRALLVQSNVRRNDGGGTLTSGVFFNERDPIVLGQPEVIDEAATDDLRNHLRRGDVPSLSPLLLLNAEMYLRAGRPRLAVIDMNAAWDLLVEQKAKAWLLHSGVSPDEAESRIERMNTVALMKDILLPNLRIPPDADFPWDDWYGRFRHLRNRVVHDAYEPSEAEGQASLANLRRLCQFVGSLQVTVEEEPEQ